MLGAIAGDIIGSLHEFEGTKTTDFPLFTLGSFFTDDTVLTVATAEKLLTGGDYAALYRRWGAKYPDAGYGGRFKRWLATPGAGPYGSFGNGSAMRVSPVAYAFGSLEEVLAEAEASAAVTHSHPEGIKGAQAAAAAVFLARAGKTKAEIREYISGTFHYDLAPSVDEIRRDYAFDETCQGSVPQAVICALSAATYADAVRKAVSLGGDADTLACITGAIAETLYGGVPFKIARRARAFLPPDILAVLDAFARRFMAGKAWPAAGYPNSG